MSDKRITFIWVNRTVVPLRTYFGSTEYYPKKQWLMEADRQELRTFALARMLQKAYAVKPTRKLAMFQSAILTSDIEVDPNLVMGNLFHVSIDSVHPDLTVLLKVGDKLQWGLEITA